MNSQQNTILLAIIALVVIGLGSIWAFGGFRAADDEIGNEDEQMGEVACTLEAKICPDGSSVGRVPPSCEFAACPGTPIEGSDQWQNATDADSGASFSYPEALPTFYSEAIDWPPQVELIEGPFECTEAGSPTDRAGVTQSRTINGTEYCVTEVVEGAAGSIYTQYAYAMEKDEDEQVILTFSTRSPQCGNFDEQQRIACEQERNSFDLDDLVDQIAETLAFDEN